MGNEHGEWIMYGVSESDPACLKNDKELIEYVNKVGFLPLFKNSVPGFSVEEHTVSDYWWSGDAVRDPWEWRRTVSESGKVAYGKFFGNKAGFISLEYLPYFANWRREGYDFDALWDDGKARTRWKKVMDLFTDGGEFYSYEIKRLAGFGKEGEKNFDGVLTELQMKTYLVVKDFRQRVNRAGEGYGWHVAVYATPESMWGYDLLSREYEAEPEASREVIYDRLRELCPAATEKQIKTLLK